MPFNWPGGGLAEPGGRRIESGSPYVALQDAKDATGGIRQRPGTMRAPIHEGCRRNACTRSVRCAGSRSLVCNEHSSSLHGHLNMHTLHVGSVGELAPGHRLVLRGVCLDAGRLWLYKAWRPPIVGGSVCNGMSKNREWRWNLCHGVYFVTGG